MKRVLLKILFCSLVIPLQIYSQPNNDFFSIENRLKFGDYLFCQGDYNRAIDEYQFILSKRNIDSLKFKIALSLRELNRYSEAENSFKKLLNQNIFKEEAQFEYYRALYLADDFNSLLKEYRVDSYSNKKFGNDIKKLVNLPKLYSQNEITDSSSFFRPFNKAESLELLKFYMRKRNLENKSPILAAIMSAVVPGLGKIYTEKYGDGITAFLVTGLLTFLSVDNFNAKHDFRGWLFAGLAAYFYAGNIYGSAASAQIYNAEVRLSFDNDLRVFLNRNNHFVPKSKWLCD